MYKSGWVGRQLFSVCTVAFCGVLYCRFCAQPLPPHNQTPGLSKWSACTSAPPSSFKNAKHTHTRRRHRECHIGHKRPTKIESRRLCARLRAARRPSRAAPLKKCSQSDLSPRLVCASVFFQTQTQLSVKVDLILAARSYVHNAASPLVVVCER